MLTDQTRHLIRYTTFLGALLLIFTEYKPLFAQEHDANSLTELRRVMVNPRDMPLYTIHMGPEFVSTWLFGINEAPAIPRGFFGKGSDSWAGSISCVGIPLDPDGAAPNADLVVRHEAIQWIKNPEVRYGPREIPKIFKLRCEMVKLHERATEPIVVTYDSGKRQEKWDVEVKLAKDHPGGGIIEITRLNDDGNGGLADIELAVKVVFMFTHAESRRSVELASPVEWLSETDHEWTRYANPAALDSYHIPESAQGNFIPASESIGGSLMAKGKCSKNARVSHSFGLAPNESVIENVSPGKLPYIKQFAPRRE